MISSNDTADQNLTMTPAEFVARRILDPKTSCAIGTFAAIAEFHRAADEPVALSEHTAITPRGGIGLRLPESVRVVSW